MAEITAREIFPFVIFLFFPLFGGIISSYFKLSPLLGYILGGIFLNQVAVHFFDTKILFGISNIGIILLLFTIGLEVNFGILKRFGSLLVKLGLLQIFLSLFAFMLAFFVLDVSFKIAAILSASFSISSTAVVAKILQERGEENSLVGGLSLGVLILQDIALIPLLILGHSVIEANAFLFLKRLFFELVKASFAFAFVYYFGTRAAPIMFDFFAKRQRELLNLFTVFFGALNLYILSLLGLSPLLAAFLTGIILAQTLEHQHIFSEIRPFRDFFAIVFFTVLGLSFPLSVFLSVFFKSLLLAVFILVLKVFIIFAISLYLKLHTRTAFSLALNLFQVGEGAFIILQQGFTDKVLPSHWYHASVGAVILLLLVTPVLIDSKERIYLTLRAFIRKHFKSIYDFISLRFDREPPRIDVLGLNNHIVICGYGRVGSYIGRALQLIGVPFVAVDYNFNVVEKARKSGVNIVYGDPTNPDVLDYLEVDKANILIVAVPDRFSQETIIANALNLNPNLRIFTRAHRERDMHRLKDLGAEVVIHPEFEASLSMVRKILILQHIPKDEIKKKLQRLKIEHWMPS